MAGPFLHYTYDTPESVGDNVITDSTGQFHDGGINRFGDATVALSVDVPAAIAARSDRSLEFAEDADGDGVRLGATIAPFQLDFNSDSWSYASWFKRSSTNAHDMVFHVGSGDGFGANNELYVYLPVGQTDVILEHFAADGAANRDIQLTKANIATGTWHHAAVIHDGPAGRMTFYVDGRLVGSDMAFSLNMDQNGPVYFGGQNATTGAGFNNRNLDGLMDDTLVWDEALFSFGVQGLYGGFFTHDDMPTNRSSDLFLYYSFEPPDSASGGGVVDSSGNGRDGTLVLAGSGTVSFAAFGPGLTPGEQALELGVFDNANAAKVSRVIGKGDLDFSTNDWSFAAWYKTDDAGVNMLMHVGSGDGFGSDNELYLNVSGGSIVLEHYKGQSLKDVGITRDGLAVDRWHHSAVTYSAVAGTFAFYVDGELVGTDDESELSMSQAAAYPVAVGGVANASRARHFNGVVDDVGIWRRTLGSSEVAELHKGEQLLFALEPVPGPATLAILAVGLGLLCLRRVFRR